MIIKSPTTEDQPRLRQLWKQAFGDSDAFLDDFFHTAFHPSRCLCIWEEDSLASAIYWFDCALGGQKIAYLYALATDTRHRGKGLARKLMMRLHDLLESRGYRAALLVPGSESLSALYRTMGYDFCGGIRTFSCTATQDSLSLRPVTPEEYALLRRQYLPEGSVIQEGAALDFLATQAQLYAGDGFLLAAQAEQEELMGLELLGNRTAAAAIVRALGCKSGWFRIPGTQKQFAMFRPLGIGTNAPPAYFAFAFD